MIVRPRQQRKPSAMSREAIWQASLRRQMLLEDAPNAQLIHLLDDQELSAEQRNDIRLELRWRLEELIHWATKEVETR